VKTLIVLGSILAFLSVFAIWIERQALNTDDWVNTSDRLIEDDTIRAALADYLVDQLYANVDVEKELEDKLPGETKDFAGPLSGVVKSAAPGGVERVLETTTGRDLWEDANRAAHEQLVAVLENKTEAVETEEGKVTLKLGELVTNLADQVGIGQSIAEKLPEDAGQVTILRSDQLETAQNITAALKGLAIVFSLLTFFFFGLAIYLSPRDERWVTVLYSGIALIAAGFVVIVLRGIAGGILVDQLVTEESIKPAAEHAWDISTSLMTSIAWTVIIFGIFFGIAGWLASPTDSARSTRRVLAPALRDWPGYVYAGLAVVFGIYFLSAPTQNLRSFLTTLVLAGLAAFGIHELRRQATEENPDLTYEDIFGGTRDRMVGAVKSANLGERASKLRLPEMRRPDGGDGGGDDARLARLERLGELHEKGLLSKEEFDAEKAKVLGGGEESS
jgi:hypothetical protein